ncbi:hypothetical protein SAMN05192552_11121, partial [Natrinema hispanicum]
MYEDVIDDEDMPLARKSILPGTGFFIALLQRRIAPVSALFSADFREACGELDAVCRY